MNQKNNEREIIEITSEENLKKIKLLQIALKEKYGRGIKIYIPDINKSIIMPETTIYGKSEILNKQLINKENIVSKNLLSQKFKLCEETEVIKINNKYTYYRDNKGEFGKDLFEAFHEKYILFQYSIKNVEVFDTSMNLYDNLRIWDASENDKNADLFAIGFKNYGVVFCGDILSNMDCLLNSGEEYSFGENTHIDLKL